MRCLILLFAALAVSAQTGFAPAPAYKQSGLATAPVTIDLFTDYTCPHCAHLFAETIPSLVTQYVKTGKVRLVHRDFPLSGPGHEQSGRAASYANAAGQAGAYDAAVNQLFRTQPEWAQDGNIDRQLAMVLLPGTMQKVRDILKTDTKLNETVREDMTIAARVDLNQTPTMIISTKSKQEKVEGFVPFAVLKARLDEILAAK